MCGSNASPTAFGWDYQVNVAIVLMMHHVKQAVNLRVEGKKEDTTIFIAQLSCPPIDQQFCPPIAQIFGRAKA